MVVVSAPDFYLVQRLQQRDRLLVGASGFDRAFACEYMGSAEFEWGALPDSLKRMRSAGRKLVVHEGEVSRGGVSVPVFIVGHRKDVAAIPERLTEWMTEPYPYGKERTHFPEQVDGTANEWEARTHAWWALNEDVMWALRADIASALLSQVRP